MKELDGLFSDSQQQLRKKTESYRVRGQGSELVIGREERTTQDPLNGWVTSTDQESIVVGCCGRATANTQDIAGICGPGREFVCRACFLICGKCGCLCCRQHSKMEKDGMVECKSCRERNKWKRILLALIRPFIEKTE